MRGVINKGAVLAWFLCVVELDGGRFLPRDSQASALATHRYAVMTHTSLCTTEGTQTQTRLSVWSRLTHNTARILSSLPTLWCCKQQRTGSCHGQGWLAPQRTPFSIYQTSQVYITIVLLPTVCFILPNKRKVYLWQLLRFCSIIGKQVKVMCSFLINTSSHIQLSTLHPELIFSVSNSHFLFSCKDTCHILQSLTSSGTGTKRLFSLLSWHASDEGI